MIQQLRDGGARTTTQVRLTTKAKTYCLSVNADPFIHAMNTDASVHSSSTYIYQPSSTCQALLKALKIECWKKKKKEIED